MRTFSIPLVVLLLVLIHFSPGIASGCAVRVIYFSLIGNEISGLHTHEQNIGQLQFKDRNLFLGGHEECVSKHYLLNGILDLRYRNKLMHYLRGKDACIDPKICPPEVVPNGQQDSLQVYWKWDDHVYERPLNWSEFVDKNLHSSRNRQAVRREVSDWLIKINSARNLMISMALKEAEKYAGEDILILPFDGSQFLLSESVADIAACARREKLERMAYVMVPMVRMNGPLEQFEKWHAQPLGVSTKAEFLATWKRSSMKLDFESEPQMGFWLSKAWNPVLDYPERYDEKLLFGKRNKVAYLEKMCHYKWMHDKPWQTEYFTSAEYQCRRRTDGCIMAGHTIRLSAMNETLPVQNGRRNSFKHPRHTARNNALNQLPGYVRKIYKATQSQHICSGVGTYPLCGPAA